MHPESLKPIPDWFKAALRGVDPLLAVRWNPRSERWQVMRRRTNGVPPSALCKKDIYEREWWQYVSVFTIAEPDDGAFRDLDMRLIHALRKGDTHHRDWRVILAEMEAEEAKIEKDKDRRLQDVQDEMYGTLRDAITEKAYSGRYAGGKIALGR